ncbi:Nif3-like dinuclear metal center hexameric protein [Flavihumibacter petaseus]|uniref:GTP cyclohydrolase 1 type 2 homolog n=1 Tax=Flavihumibacter petaseus NBRC 106054 TaxID=1220578 RepID=A0A0E9MUP9_9BACT|nr:Nif3-like dinuclear metal center hexameric protein [Flavihumibacter petaseus]GAO41304.1 Nif3 family protein [Flavihumibacter petaseus NBRC 106054]
MRINEITDALEQLAPPAFQEAYDNTGLLTGNSGWDCRGVLVSLDATEEIVQEAIDRDCNLIVAHHPILFSGLKKLTGKNYLEKAIILAIKADIAIYAIHTNLDNVLNGVNGRIARQMGLEHTRILQPKEGMLRKLVTYVPQGYLDQVRNALFAAGGGHIGNYSECSFSAPGTGTFRGGENTNPFDGTPGIRQESPEFKLELVYPLPMERAILKALRNSHPYEEIAVDLLPLGNRHDGIGSGIWGELPVAMAETSFLEWLKGIFRVPVIRHTKLLNRPVKRVAVCGGAGSFLISNAIGINADAYITADMKYHQFFDADSRLLLADPGHFETEQFTIDLLHEYLAEKFPTFAVFKTGQSTNPVNYYT